MAVFDEILKLMSIFFSMETGSPFMTLVGLCRWDLGWESWLKDRLKRSKRATSKSILTGWFSILLSVRWICIIHQNKSILIGTAWKNCALGFSFYLFYDFFIANLRHICYKYPKGVDNIRWKCVLNFYIFNLLDNWRLWQKENFHARTALFIFH